MENLCEDYQFTIQAIIAFATTIAVIISLVMSYLRYIERLPKIDGLLNLEFENGNNLFGSNVKIDNKPIYKKGDVLFLTATITNIGGVKITIPTDLFYFKVFKNSRFHQLLIFLFELFPCVEKSKNLPIVFKLYNSNKIEPNKIEPDKIEIDDTHYFFDKYSLNLKEKLKEKGSLSNIKAFVVTNHGDFELRIDKDLKEKMLNYSKE